MNDFIKIATPLALSMFMSLVGVVSVLISQGTQVSSEADYKKRSEKAWSLILSALPQSLCLAAFSFDIWAVTTLLTGDDTTQTLYNLKDKESSILILIVVHVILYNFVLAWGGVVRGQKEGSDTKKGLEIFISTIAIILCILFQVY